MDMNEQLGRIGEGYAELCKERMGIDLDFSAESVEWLDRNIAENFPDGCFLHTTIVSVAAYLGETVRRLLGGSWIEHEKMGPCVEVKGLLVNVFAWTRKRFNDGEGDSLAAKLAALQKMVADRSDVA